MKQLSSISWLLLFTLLSLNVGCEKPAELNQTETVTDEIIDKLAFYTRYAPIKIDIMPLTELVSIGGTQRYNINIYVSLLDQFGSQIKSPGTFRFELYKYTTGSAKRKGKRIIIWPDIDLTDPVTNNDYWLDFLRTYHFSLPYESQFKEDYILQLTCLCPNGKRLSSEFTLRNTKTP